MKQSLNAMQVWARDEKSPLRRSGLGFALQRDCCAT
jgi:hypothetical protein